MRLRGSFLNAEPERLLKTVAGTLTSYAYDINGHLIAESNGSTGAMTQEYVWIDNTPVAQIAADGTIYYIHNDQLGTPQKMTNSSQAVVWDRTQEPFGETFSISGTATNNLRFPGQYFDSESGLNYNLKRSLDTSTGRYTQTDPLGLAGGINPYAYVAGNPLSWIDPTGTDGRNTARTICLLLGAACQTDNFPDNSPSQSLPPSENAAHQSVPDQPWEQKSPRWKPTNPFPSRPVTQCPARPNIPATGPRPPLGLDADAAVSIGARLTASTLAAVAIAATIILTPGGMATDQ